jgi:Tfp pilus assembly protein PilN
MHRINLISSTRRMDRRQRVRRRSWVVAFVSYSVLIAAASLIYRGIDTYADAGTLTENLAGLDAELGEIEKQRAGLRPELAELRLVLTAGRSITDQPDWSLLLIYLADEVLGEEIILSGCALGPVVGGGQDKNIQDSSVAVTLTGHAKTTSDVSRFVLRLEESGLFNRVTLERTSREPFLDGQAIAFEIYSLMSNGGGGSHE